MSERLIQIQDLELISCIFGNFDENIKILENEFDIKVTNRGGELKLNGAEPDVELAVKAADQLIKMAEKSEALDTQSVKYVCAVIKEGNEGRLKELLSSCVLINAKGKPILPKTIGQKEYVNAIEKNIIVLGVGPAGTGKTYLAVAMAVAAFKAKRVSRIILTRPAVEAGEKLGFLPGDLQTKIDPYLRPLYDALFDTMGSEAYARHLERGAIEVAPLAYMRGRTLDNAFIILDEAQNTTTEQMKMFLTRIGFGSKTVITGDITQIDLPEGKRSGMLEALDVLKNIKDIGICRFSKSDVVRHEIIQRIVEAYEKYYDYKKRL